jgi:hypothetical protein
MGRSYMLLISSHSMSLVVALLMMFVSDVLSHAELPRSKCKLVFGTTDAEANAVKALYTGWGILSAMGGKECSDPCACGWEGVVCVELTQPEEGIDICYMYSVIGLELIGLGLRGQLSGAIRNLTNLQILTITGNPGLTGNLPSEIGSLTNLTHLDLHDNNFTGVIPNLTRLANLITLFLNGNAFSGSIEHVFQGLNTNRSTNLYFTNFFRRVDLSSNQFTGCIPGLMTGCSGFFGIYGKLL